MKTLGLMTVANATVRSITTTLAISTIVVAAATTSLLNILDAYADEDRKIKSFTPEGDEHGGAASQCFKDSEGPIDCKDRNVNKEAREACEGTNDGDKCKRFNFKSLN